MQADTSTSPVRMITHVRKIYVAGGVSGFWIGVGTTVSRAVVLGANNLGTYSSAKSTLASPPYHLDGIPLHICSSVVAGLAIAVTTAPIDFARSRLMCGKLSGSDKVVFRNGFRVIVDAVHREGALSPYKGFGPQWMRTAPTTVLQYLAWERALPGSRNQQRMNITILNRSRHVRAFHSS